MYIVNKLIKSPHCRWLRASEGVEYALNRLMTQGYS